MVTNSACRCLIPYSTIKLQNYLVVTLLYDIIIVYCNLNEMFVSATLFTIITGIFQKKFLKNVWLT